MSPPSSTVSPLPRRAAGLLVCAVFPVIWVGGLVTTYDAGMAVPDWPNTYGYNLFLYPWQTWLSGPFDIFVEHGHRLFASLAGLLTIGLLVALWKREPRRWVRLLGVLALVAVLGQGLLGGLRVLLDERLLAQIHACVGPAYFALCGAIYVVTSRSDSGATPDSVSGADFKVSARLGNLAIVTAVLTYLQIVLGSALRHAPASFPASEFRAVVWAHLALAAAVLWHAGWLAWRTRREFRDAPAEIRRPCFRHASALAGLVLAQVALGAGSWIVNYGWPTWFANQAFAESYVVTRNSMAQALVTTAHVANGSLILLIAVALAIRLGSRVDRAAPRWAGASSSETVRLAGAVL